ncbi:MAG: hypothetical protein PHR28_11200 [candidate division Zixibacteria bacterium]|nr:hypothetical protein [candidate division Zixibacteria bacterium]
MATSKKQIRANRRNARLSTGPKSIEGKAISSRNSLKHGRYSKKRLIDSPTLKEAGGDSDGSEAPTSAMGGAEHPE